MPGSEREPVPVRLDGAPASAVAARRPRPVRRSATLRVGVPINRRVLLLLVVAVVLTGASLPFVGSGTGGALTPVLGQFGLSTALSIVSSYVVAVTVTPSAVAVWARYAG